MTTQHTTIPLQSLGCASRGRAAIERALLDIPGVLRAYVNQVTEMAYVKFDPALSDAQVIGAAIRQTGYAEMRPVPPPPVHPSGERSDVDTTRVALATGVWLAAAFAACAIVRAVLPAADGAFRLWTLVLPGVQTLRWWELLLGLAESLTLGLIGGWAFALIYNRLGLRPPRSGPAQTNGASGPARGRLYETAGGLLAARRVVGAAFGPASARPFAVRYWTGDTEPAATAGPARFAVVIRDPDALRRALLPPSELALGEAFIRGDLDVEGDLEAAGYLVGTSEQATVDLPAARAAAALPVEAPPRAGTFAANPAMKRLRSAADLRMDNAVVAGAGLLEGERILHGL